MTQEAVLRFLRDPGSYPDAGSFEVRSTHASWVFLAGPRAYKLKKAVKFPFMDYSTPDLRRHFCEEEVRLNRRLAPAIYLGVLPIVQRTEGTEKTEKTGEPGRLAFGTMDGAKADRDRSEGREVDAVVVMERLRPEEMLDHGLESGTAGEESIDLVAGLLERFYRGSPRSPAIDRMGSPDAIRRNVAENLEETEAFVGSLVPENVHAAIRSCQLSFLEIHRRLFEARVKEGRIRDGHGDLRAEHVAFTPEPAVIDCIEFADRFRQGDVAADLAFLRMDLEFLGHEDLGERLIGRHVEASRDEGLRGVLGFYVSYRAHVRGKVDGLKSRQSEVDRAERAAAAEKARRYFELAHRHARAVHAPLLILVGGLSGTGKSTLARGLAGILGAAVIRSDAVRKELASTPGEAEKAFREGLYSSAATRRTYEEMAARGAGRLSEGGTVILDGTFSRELDREEAERAARKAGARLLYLECRVAPEVAAERLRRREAEGGDISDATPAIHGMQRASYEEPARIIPAGIDASADPERVLEAALGALRSRLGG